MYERFTGAARRVVVGAQEEAVALNHNYIGTEHILLGLLREDESSSAVVLKSLGLTLESVRQQVEDIIGKGQARPPGHIPMTPRSKKVLELSLREALQLGHNYIGTEHILLALIREGEGVAAQVIVKDGVSLNQARSAVIDYLHDSKKPVRAETSAKLDEVSQALEQAAEDLQQMLSGRPPRAAMEQVKPVSQYAQISISPTAADLLRDVSKRMGAELGRRVTLSEAVEKLVDLYY